MWSPCLLGHGCPQGRGEQGRVGSSVHAGSQPGPGLLWGAARGLQGQAVQACCFWDRDLQGLEQELGHR